jgi:hypothetical protein
MSLAPIVPRGGIAARLLVSRYFVDVAVGHCDLGKEFAALNAGDARAIADAKLTVGLEFRTEHGRFFIAETLADAFGEGFLAGLVCDDHCIVPY